MSTINFQLYNAGVLNLARTIIIKDSDVADAYNQYVQYRGYVVDADKATWKYYLNMSGQYHEVDTPMTIRSLDTREEIPFRRDVLLNHRATLREYGYGSDYYNALVDRFPQQEFLIRCILNPVDIQTAVNAKDFQIVYFDKSLVEVQETDLISKLQTFIFNLVNRWHVPAFKVSDELYPHAFHAMLKNFLPEKIENIRLENCLTYRAHSFYIWEFLESHGYLSAYRSVLTLEQTMWLYRNIRWVYSGVGREDTFNTLMEVVLTGRGIPVGSYEMKHNVAEMPDELTPTPVMQRTALNLRRSLNTVTTVNSLDYIMERQVPLALNNFEALEYSLPETRSALRTTRQSSMPTKVYESEMVDLAGSEPFSLADVLLNHWISMAGTGRYTSVITVQNPYNGDIMTMDMKEAFLTWLYTYNKSTGHALITIGKFKANMTIRTPVPSFDLLRSVTVKRWIPDAYINQILDEAPLVGSPISTEAFYVTCHDIHRNALARRFAYTSQSNREVRKGLQTIFNNLYETAEYALNSVEDETYLTYFANRGWAVDELNKEDSKLLAEDILKKATGTDTQSILSLKDIQASMLKLMSQLGTYSVQYIQTINSTALIPCGPNHIRVGDVRSSDSTQLQINDPTVGVTDVSVNMLTVLPVDSGMVAVTAEARDPLRTVKIRLKLRARVRSGFTSTFKVGTSVVRVTSEEETPPEILTIP